MKIYQAAEVLQDKLERFDWLTAVAVGTLDGNEVIYVYLNRMPRDLEIESLRRDGWQGYRVMVERAGKIRSAIRQE